MVERMFCKHMTTVRFCQEAQSWVGRVAIALGCRPSGRKASGGAIPSPSTARRRSLMVKQALGKG